MELEEQPKSDSPYWKLKHRAFTWVKHNYTADDLSFLNNFTCQYICYGKEVCPTTNRPHLQGYVYFTNAKMYGTLRRLLFFSWIMPSRGSPLSNEKYTSKDCIWYERGIKPQDPRAQGEPEKDKWAEARALAKIGDFDNINDRIYLAYKRTLHEIYEENKKVKISHVIIDLYPWQQQALETLLAEPDPRKIIWYWDEPGEKGKTAFAHYMVHHHGALLLEDGEKKDIAYKIKGEPKIVIFDYTKTFERKVSYSVLESIKNGVISSDKYQSQMKFFPKPHVLVLANFPPNKTAMGQNRFDVIHLI